MKDIYEFSANDLLLGYTMGVFPMAKNSDDDKVTWVRPELRGIIPINNLHISRSLKRKINSNNYSCSFNTSFLQVVNLCRTRKETWINGNLVEKYLELHNRRFAQSVEIWYEDKLIGGLFGITIGACFFAESMFSEKTDGSKLAMVALFNRLKTCGYKLFDTQFYTPHLGRMGAIEISQLEYEEILKTCIHESVTFFEQNDRNDHLHVPKPISSSRL